MPENLLYFSLLLIFFISAIIVIFIIIKFIQVFLKKGINVIGKEVKTRASAISDEINKAKSSLTKKTKDI